MNTPGKLDPTDIGILELLEKDGRLPHKVIAHQLHRTVTPIHARIRWLQQDGFIKRITALVDAKKICRGVTAYTQVQLRTHSSESLKAFMEEVVKIPEVMECYHMTGAFDFLLRIAIGDMDAYNVLLVKKLGNLPEIANVQSFFVISEAKYRTSFFQTFTASFRSAENRGGEKGCRFVCVRHPSYAKPCWLFLRVGVRLIQKLLNEE